MGLLECRWREGTVRHGEGFACHHPRVHAPDGLVSAAVCSMCEWRGSRDPGVGAGEDTVWNQPAQVRAPPDESRVTSWAVGVTTAPRPQPTLERTLSSLSAAGWERPRLFAEPGAALPSAFASLPQSRRESRLGAFSNWYLGLTELFFREPRTDAYLMCQDDAVFALGARDYLETTLWPAANVGVVSIYTPSHWSAGRAPGFHPAPHGWDTWGALAYVFSNQATRALLSHPLFVSHRHHGMADGMRNIDSVVGAWCLAAGLPYFIHVPSLAQHIGQTSTIWQRASASGPRRAADFVASVGNALSGVPSAADAATVAPTLRGGEALAFGDRGITT